MKKYIYLLFVFGFLFVMCSCDFTFINEPLPVDDEPIDEPVVLKKFEYARMNNTSVQFDGKEHTIVVGGVPESAKATITYENEGPYSEIGEYHISATVTATGYETMELEAKLTIYGPFTAGNVSEPYITEMSKDFEEFEYNFDFSSVTAQTEKLNEFLTSEQVDLESFELAIEDLNDLMEEFLTQFYYLRAIYYADPSIENEELYNSVYDSYLTYTVWVSEFETGLKDSVYRTIYFEDMTEEEIDAYLLSGFSNERTQEIEARIEEIGILGQNLVSTGGPNTFDLGFELYYELMQLEDELANLRGYDNYIEYEFNNYGKQFDPSAILAISENVKKYIVPVVDMSFLDDYDNYFAYSVLGNYRYSGIDMLKYVEAYLQQLNDDSYDLYSDLYLNGTYLFTANESSLGTGFTSYAGNDHYMVYFSADYQNAGTFIHEFGHYQGHNFSTVDFSLDIDEICSQGNEALFYAYIMNHLDTKHAKMQKLYVQYNLINLFGMAADLISTAEVEYFGSTHTDMPKEEMKQAFRDMIAAYDGAADETYWIYGCLQSPGYYSSYVTSAIASMELYCLAMQDYEAAKESYNTLIHYSDEEHVTDEEILAAMGLSSFFSDHAYKLIYTEMAELFGIDVEPLPEE